jgi:GDPmannose 4,6-dehydratase
MLRLDYPDNFVCVIVESKVELKWIGSGLNDVGLYNNEAMVKVNREFYRPLQSDNNKADYSKAKKKLKWEPKTKFKNLVKIMGKNDLKP